MYENALNGDLNTLIKINQSINQSIHTIFNELGAAKRAEMGISDSMIRLSVGIEDLDDLLEDFKNALA